MTHAKHSIRAGSTALRACTIKACATFGLLVAAFPGLAHAHWVYTERLTPDNDHTFLVHDNIEAYVSLATHRFFDSGGITAVNTHEEDVLRLAVRVKCVGYDVTDWIYSGDGEHGVHYDCPEGVDTEWGEGSIWAED
jgi:hypothetical protein